jgi:hypothetical protein
VQLHLSFGYPANWRANTSSRAACGIKAESFERSYLHGDTNINRFGNGRKGVPATRLLPPPTVNYPADGSRLPYAAGRSWDAVVVVQQNVYSYLVYRLSKYYIHKQNDSEKVGVEVAPDESPRRSKFAAIPAVLAFLLPWLTNPYPRRRVHAAGAKNVICLATLSGLSFAYPSQALSLGHWLSIMVP